MTQALPTPTLTAQPDTTRSRRFYNPVQKDAVTFVQTAEETSGACSLFDMEIAPGGGNCRQSTRAAGKEL